VPKHIDEYIPARADVVWLQFNPQAGSEQAGHRPALVISPKAYNARVGLALFCPISSQIKGYPFEVEITDGGKISGVILADQLKNLDWRVRQIEFIEKVSHKVLHETLSKMNTLIGLTKN